MTNQKYTDDFIEFVRQHKKMLNVDLIELIKIHYPQYSFTKSKMCNFRHRYNLQSGIRGGTFPKGHIPFNKGKKMSAETYAKLRSTMFQKGNITYNTREIGSIRYDKDGYKKIKVSDDKKGKANWQLYHRYIFEKEFGKVPKGYAVIFADGNKYNFDLDNLVLVSRNELARLNQDKLIFDNADLTKSGLQLVKMKNKIRSLEK